MDFEIVDLGTITEENLIKVISKNLKTSRLMAAEIDNLRKHSTPFLSQDEENDEESAFDDSKVNDNESDEDFEDEVDYYYQLFKSYKIDDLEGDISRILPNRKKYNYERILHRMRAEVLKSIKQIKDFINSENVTLEEAELFRGDLLLERKRLEVLDRHLGPEAIDVDEVIENKLVFFPTANGNIHVFDFLESLDPSYFERFNDLFMSIKNGTFKNVKRFRNHNMLTGLSEVKAPLARVVYARLSSDVYVIISAFIKKTHVDQGYSNFLVKHCRDYRNIERLLRKNIDDEEFMRLNSEYEKELFRLLGNSVKEESTINEKRGSSYGQYFKTN